MSHWLSLLPLDDTIPDPIKTAISSASAEGDTAWVLTSAALVLLMTVALAFFYGGMVRAKNVLGMLMQNFYCIAAVSVLWVLFGFSIAFGGSNSVWGGLHFALLHHMDEIIPGGTYTTPTLAFFAFQVTFAIITPALITGSTADRWRFGAFAIFVALWSTLVYDPIAHWVFAPTGWLFKRGAEDFAGGTVVHANAGAAGLAMCLVLGKRIGWPKQAMKPHNVPYVMLGAGLLWFGWFGFNSGSAIAANNLASYAWVNTNTATAAALLGWIIVERIRDGHATTLGAASGAVAGLVAITPAAGFVTPYGSIALGAIAGAVCCLCTVIKTKIGFDDSLDVVAVHLVGGILGALLIGFFGDKATGIGIDGIFKGGGGHLLKLQAEDVGATVGYSFVATLIIGYAMNLVFKHRMPEDQEIAGMDISLHGESAYDMGAGTSGTLVGAHSVSTPAPAPAPAPATSAYSTASPPSAPSITMPSPLTPPATPSEA
ncbi:MAG TPA: ammonium transporter [Mycobacteriales bacterium]|nr:ammonium transporter [Mycobacteriales bacterium]